MMLVLSLLILATLVLSFYSVDQVTAAAAQMLSGTGRLALLAVLVPLVGWLIWKKRRASASASVTPPRQP